MINLNFRQQLIFDFIRKNQNAQNKDIKEYLAKNKIDISRFSIARDLDFLLEKKIIQKNGQGRNTFYSENLTNNLLGYFNVEEYFKKESDDREIKYKNFNFDVFKNLKNLFTSEEINNFKNINKKYQDQLKTLSPTIIQKEIERLIIELSWKSSQIEGNTYSLIDTEILLKNNQEASGHKKEEAIMLLNHKNALNYAFSNKEEFKKLNFKNIENIHSLIVDNLDIKKGLRKNLVGIIGTNYRPIDNQHQIIEALEKMINCVNESDFPLEKALIINLMIAYIQPFEDGNKRTSRILSNAILITNNYCPLSFRSIDEKEYKKAIILFYEQNNASYFKELFLEQFEFGVNHYFQK